MDSIDDLQLGSGGGLPQLQRRRTVVCWAQDCWSNAPFRRSFARYLTRSGTNLQDSGPGMESPGSVQIRMNGKAVRSGGDKVQTGAVCEKMRGWRLRLKVLRGRGLLLTCPVSTRKTA